MDPTLDKISRIFFKLNDLFREESASKDEAFNSMLLFMQTLNSSWEEHIQNSEIFYKGLVHKPKYEQAHIALQKYLSNVPIDVN